MANEKKRTKKKTGKPAKNEPEPKGKSAANHHGTVLLIDDSPSSLERVAAILTAAGWQVLTAENGFDGIRLVFKDSPDVVVCDVVMPELNGYQLCRLLKNDASIAHIPVVLLTALGEERDRFWGTEAGAERYIIKKSADTELVPAIEEVVASARMAAHYSGTLYYVSDAELDNSTIKSKVSFLLDKLLFEQTLVNQTRRLSGLIHHRNRFVADLLGLVASLVTYDRAALLLRDMNGADLYIDSAKPVAPAAQRRLLETAVRDSGDMRLFDRHRVTYLRAERAERAEHDGDGEAPSMVSCRLAADEDYLGTIVIERSAEPYTEDASTILQLIGRTVAMAVKLMLLYEENRWLSVTDPLTQLYNRRYFIEHFENQFRQFMRYDVTASLLFADIDNFKLLNDTYGHNVADMVLKQLADLIKSSIRTVDLAARVGGEEFVVLLPQTPAARAMILAERLRAKIERHAFGAEEQPITVTVSVGVSEFDKNMREAQSLLDRADRAMLQGKADGKNRVVLRVSD